MLKINVKDKELNMEVAGNIETITKEFCIAAMTLKGKLDSDDKINGLIFANTLVAAMTDFKGKDMERVTSELVRKAFGLGDD